MKVKHEKSLEETNEYGVIRESKEGKGAYELISPIALKELALVYEEGAVGHGDRNWEKGAKFGKTLQSAIRHIYQRIEGCQDERHLAQAAWNLFTVIHYEEMIKRGLLSKELNDLPSYVKKELFMIDGKGSEISGEKSPNGVRGDRAKLGYFPESFEEEMKILNNEYDKHILQEIFGASSKPHTAYFSHHIRGVKGNNATDEEQDANREDAIRVCNQLRELLPDWKIYCPAEVDEVVSELFKSKAIGEKEILDADCKILERRDVLFAYIKGDHVSRGMQIERDHAYKVGIPVISFAILDDWAEQNILDSLTPKLGFTL